MRKKILLVSRHAPYGTTTAREALDSALAAAVYDQDISLLFIDDGVFQLLKSQSGREIAQKSLDAIISALPYYDIENIYIHTESLAQRHIVAEDIVVANVILLDNTAAAKLFEQQDHILSF
jgi:tRNA 2-thiouridine synthesizing protein C